MIAIVSRVASAQQGSAALPGPTEPAPSRSRHGSNDQELVAAAQDPISSMISLPIQFNFNGNQGAYDRTQLTVKVQPILPIRLSRNLTLVNRLIFPIVSQPDTAEPSGSTGGFGDFEPQIFVAVSLPAKLALGAGPTASVPIATDSDLGNGKLAIGPAAVMVYRPSRIVTGVLVTQLWSIAGMPGRRSVDLLTLQPFFNLNLSQSVYLTASPVITHDAENREWTVPIGLGVGQVLDLNGQHTNVSLHGYWNAVHPEEGSAWQLRTQVQFLFPTSPSER